MKFTILASVVFAFAASALASPMEARQAVEHCRSHPSASLLEPFGHLLWSFHRRRWWNLHHIGPRLQLHFLST
ncbi:hypothetical protein BKA70DRAFT_1557832 [Coprinopsis sp. MPI-PUGE-AT-0042]|nr:hypothetical protein BKA70DRAFT_1557832 [Coprinopsis sp. MPI-PUGE-AT-0042]